MGVRVRAQCFCERLNASTRAGRCRARPWSAALLRASLLGDALYCASLLGAETSLMTARLQRHTDSHERCALIHPALPDPDDPPAGGSQLRRNSPISRAIGANFPAPKVDILAWREIMTRASVPETAVHEYGHLLTAPGKIRPSWKSLVTSPASQPSTPYQDRER